MFFRDFRICCRICWSARKGTRKVGLIRLKPDFEKRGMLRWYLVENWFNSSQIKWENFQPELDNLTFHKVSILIHFCPLNPKDGNPPRSNWLSFFPSDGFEFWSNFLSFSKLQSFLKCLWQQLRDSQVKHQTERPSGNRKHLWEISFFDISIFLVQYSVSTVNMYRRKRLVILKELCQTKADVAPSYYVVWEVREFIHFIDVIYLFIHRETCCRHPIFFKNVHTHTLSDNEVYSS